MCVYIYIYINIYINSPTLWPKTCQIIWTFNPSTLDGPRPYLPRQPWISKLPAPTARQPAAGPKSEASGSFLGFLETGPFWESFCIRCIFSYGTQNGRQNRTITAPCLHNDLLSKRPWLQPHLDLRLPSPPDAPRQPKNGAIWRQPATIPKKLSTDEPCSADVGPILV